MITKDEIMKLDIACLEITFNSKRKLRSSPMGAAEILFSINLFNRQGKDFVKFAGYLVNKNLIETIEIIE